MRVPGLAWLGALAEDGRCCVAGSAARRSCLLPRRLLNVPAPACHACPAQLPCLPAGLHAGGDKEDDAGSESSEEGSSFFSGGASSQSDLSDAEEDGQQQQQQRQEQPRAGQRAPAAAEAAARQQQRRQQQEEGWEADTATDSDDDAHFMEAYGQAMDVQLAGTRMVDSFERAPAADGPAGGQQQQQGRAAAAAAAAAAEGGDGAGEAAAEHATATAALRPVDIDMNLVKSLLASYGEQGGLPGPAGNLAGLMGLKLPDQPPGSG